MPGFRLLGPLEVRTGAEWQGIPAPKWRAVLAALLINAGQAVSTDTLIDEVWGYAPPAKAANLISIYVLRLRRLIGDTDGSVLATRSPGYQLRLSAADIDAQQFEVIAGEGRRLLAAGAPEQAASRLAEALTLWHGSPLADVPRSPLVEAEAERLGELRLNAAELRITAELNCNRQAQVVPELRRLLADHPLREGLWLLLMRALDTAGRHAEALDAYGQARTVIAGELGVDPGAELRRFYTELLAADNAGTPAHTAAAAPAASVLAPRPGADLMPASRAAPVIKNPPPAAEPHNVTECESFSRELTLARLQARLTAEEVAEAAGIETGEAHDVFAGRTLPACSEAGLKTLRAILAACGITGLEQVIAWTDALARVWPEAAPGPETRAMPAAAAIPDSPGFDLCPDPLTARTAPELVSTLAQFRLWAGEPSFREMAQACRHTASPVSAATMCTALRNDKLPSLQVVLAIVSACGGTEEHQQAFATAWRTIRMTPSSGGLHKRMLYPVPDTG